MYRLSLYDLLDTRPEPPHLGRTLYMRPNASHMLQMYGTNAARTGAYRQFHTGWGDLDWYFTPTAPPRNCLVSVCRAKLNRDISALRALRGMACVYGATGTSGHRIV